MTWLFVRQLLFWYKEWNESFLSNGPPPPYGIIRIRKWNICDEVHGDWRSQRCMDWQWLKETMKVMMRIIYSSINIAKFDKFLHIFSKLWLVPITWNINSMVLLNPKWHATKTLCLTWRIWNPVKPSIAYKRPSWYNKPF